jgi:hypothetical protein
MRRCTSRVRVCSRRSGVCLPACLLTRRTRKWVGGGGTVPSFQARPRGMPEAHKGRALRQASPAATKLSCQTRARGAPARSAKHFKASSKREEHLRSGRHERYDDGLGERGPRVPEVAGSRPPCSLCSDSEKEPPARGRGILEPAPRIGVHAERDLNCLCRSGGGIGVLARRSLAPAPPARCPRVHQTASPHQQGSHADSPYQQGSHADQDKLVQGVGTAEGNAHPTPCTAAVCVSQPQLAASATACQLCLLEHAHRRSHQRACATYQRRGACATYQRRGACATYQRRGACATAIYQRRGACSTAKCCAAASAVACMY